MSVDPPPEHVLSAFGLSGVRRGEGEDVADLADDAVGGDDGHVGLEAVGGALVDVEHAGLVDAAGADDLGGDGLRDILLLEAEDGLRAPLERARDDCVEPDLRQAIQKKQQNGKPAEIEQRYG